MNFKDSFIRKFDWLLFLAAFLLSTIGLVGIYSADLAKSNTDFGNFKMQGIALSLGLLAMFIMSFWNFRQLRNARNILYLAGLVMLAAVLFLGKTLRGTTGWFVLGPLSFQPVEVAKIFLVIFLADYFAREGRSLFRFLDVSKSMLAVAIFIIPVMMQPDLGSSIILFLLWLGMLLVSRVQKKHILIIFIFFAAVALAAWFFALAPYQKNRLKVFIDPNLDPLGAGYNIKQSIIAIGSGGFFGKGLGFGSQSQLRFLPEIHTDFIFALIAEEMGFFVVVILLGLFAIIFRQVFRISQIGESDFVAYLCIGFLIIIFSEMLINIGMNLGLMPVTGLALPFVSAGGSSLLAKFAMLGILESARMRI